SKPLFLTPYIESGQLDEGRKLSEVVGLPDVVLKRKTNVPVLLWLQGGPGGSSLFGLFVENGPIKVSADGMPYMRDDTWNREF
ncbi:hypothetical protein BLA29_013020, partial [Euroglyphus maynei]